MQKVHLHSQSGWVYAPFARSAEIIRRAYDVAQFFFGSKRVNLRIFTALTPHHSTSCDRGFPQPKITFGIAPKLPALVLSGDLERFHCNNELIILLKKQACRRIALVNVICQSSHNFAHLPKGYLFRGRN